MPMAYHADITWRISRGSVRPLARTVGGRHRLRLGAPDRDTFVYFTLSALLLAACAIAAIRWTSAAVKTGTEQAPLAQDWVTSVRR